MNNRKCVEAASRSAIDFELSTAEINSTAHGLKQKSTFARVQLGEVGGNARACGIIVSPRRMMRYGGRSPYDCRRIAAAPCASRARGVSFGTFGNFLPSGSSLIRTFAKNLAIAIRKHGIVASIDFMGAPCGELSSSPLPTERYFLHPHGAAHPVGRVGGFQSSTVGATAMTLHDAAGVCTHAYTLGVCRLLNAVNRLTGRAGSVRPRGSYLGDDFAQLPSIFKVNPELLELAQAETLKRSQGVSHD